MNKLLLTGLLFLSGPFYANAQETIDIDSNYANGHYLQRLDFFKKMPNQKKEIVFVGNSITEGGKWQELIPNKHVINRGISGDVTYGILARLDEILASKPLKIFLLSGINDMKRGTPNEVILANYLRMIKKIKAESPATQVYFQSVLPVNIPMLPKSYEKLSNSKILALNEGLKALCNTYKLRYVDLHAVFANQDGALKKELSIDGLHLRSAAYILWADYLKKEHLL
ncbi:GDSL family lipase [Pedobacter sp. HMWF019]|uniref:GDSL-type esterase/lipase family protein n=1 Tax=Pedobacter sp. HMWF019 TaxID=2056856 RepID=UPI000D37A655|nr:GDSL-type esterase/lipase family protein [Pedobacter sp. HMWF019]PTT02968.1 GDSL family lipase [Pedobacter sp. HMWF019]